MVVIMAKLSEPGLRILQHLVRLLPGIQPGKPESYPTYSDVHGALGLPGNAQNLEHQGLAQLAIFIRDGKLPAITGLIVAKETRRPGGGYFTVYKKDKDDFPWWEEQIGLSKDFPWKPYIVNSSQHQASPPETPKAGDIAPPEPPGRVETTTYRILRDTRLACAIKQKHQFQCQICGESIQLASGESYAEAHHIRPLGSPHNGPDVEGNIICVCPNHHVELDYFARPLDLTLLRTVLGHQIAQNYIDFHNSHYRKLTQQK